MTSTLRTWLICWSSQHQPLPNSHPTPPVPLREQVDSLHLCNRDESTATLILISPRWLMLVAHLKIPKRSVNKREMPHKWDKLSVHEIDPFANRNHYRKGKWASNGQYFGKTRSHGEESQWISLIHRNQIQQWNKHVRKFLLPSELQKPALRAPRPVSAMSWHKYTSAIRPMKSQETSMSLGFLDYHTSTIG